MNYSKSNMHEIGSEFDWKSNDRFLNDEVIWEKLNSATYFRSGRDALKELALYHRERHDRILIPALSCDSMVQPFLQNGYEVVFFKMSSDYVIDKRDLEEKVNGKDIILFMRYFGIPCIEDDFVKSIKKNYKNTLWVEDRTHDILHISRVGEFEADETIASIRKWLSVGDGGLSWNSRGRYPQKQDSFFSDLRIRAMKEKSVYLDCGNSNLKESFRKELSKANNLLNQDTYPYAMTEQSVNLLKKINFQKLLEIRIHNAISLKRLLLDLDKSEMIQFITDKPEASTLYFPILVNCRNELQSFLTKRGIFCPVIWPVPEKAVGICEVAEYTAEHMIGIPCDQRYSSIDMEYISEMIHEFYK